MERDRGRNTTGRESGRSLARSMFETERCAWLSTDFLGDDVTARVLPSKKSGVCIVTKHIRDSFEKRYFIMNGLCPTLASRGFD